MALALPSQAFSDVQRYLRQRRAGGQTVTPRESRLAWQAYWDVNAARALQSRQLGQQDIALQLQKNRLELAEEQMEREEAAAKVSGIAELGSTAAMGAFALKGTSIGAKVGLGAPAAVSAAAPAATGAAAPATAGAAAALGGKGATIAASQAAAAPAASAPFSATSVLGPAGAGVAAGFLGSEIGERVVGNDAGEIAGGALGGAAGGALIGSQIGSVGGPVGAIIGGVIGGAIGVVKSIKD